MNAYAAQDAQEERRLEHAAWQDAVDTEVQQITSDAFFGVDQSILDKFSDDAQDALFNSLCKQIKRRFFS